MSALSIEALSALVPEEGIPTEQIVHMRDISSRGILAKRVTLNGRIANDEILLITGAYVSGYAGDSRSIKGVYARPLVIENGFATVPSGESILFDPDLTAIKVGEIDYLDPNNEEFFRPLGTRF